MEEAISKTRGVEVAPGREAGDQRRIDGLFVVAVVGRAWLFAVDLHRVAVGINDAELDAGVGVGQLVGAQGEGEGVAGSFKISGHVGIGDAGNETRGGRLRGKALVERAVSLAIPGGDADSGVVCETVGVVLAGMSEGAGIDPLTKKHRILVTDLGGVARIKDLV